MKRSIVIASALLIVFSAACEKAKDEPRGSAAAPQETQAEGPKGKATNRNGAQTQKSTRALADPTPTAPTRPMAAAAKAVRAWADSLTKRGDIVVVSLTLGKPARDTQLAGFADKLPAELLALLKEINGIEVRWRLKERGLNKQTVGVVYFPPLGPEWDSENSWDAWLSEDFEDYEDFRGKERRLPIQHVSPGTYAFFGHATGQPASKATLQWHSGSGKTSALGTLKDYLLRGIEADFARGWQAR